MPPAAMADFAQEAVLVIKIGRSLDEGRSVYDATRAAWKLDPDRARRADWIVAARQGKILEVFEAERWVHAFDPEIAHLTRPDQDDDRYGFVGKPAPTEAREQWVGRQLPPELMRPGAANPVRYVNV